MTMVHADFAVSLASVLAYTAGQTKHQVLLANEKSSLVATARNNLVRRALEWGADAVLFLDSDMTFPSDTLDRLWNHHRMVVGATANRRAPPYTTVGDFPVPPHPGQTGLLAATMLPVCCAMINTAVFEKVQAPWFRETYDEADRSESNPDGVVGEDVNFCRSARKAGIEFWCDLDLTFDPSMAHIGEQRIRVRAPA